MNSTLWKIIPPYFRRRAIFVTATIFLRAILNFVGVAMFIPILMLILDSSTATQDGLLGDIYDLFGFESHKAFVIAVCCAILVIILLKNILSLLLYRAERNFIFSLYKYLSIRLYKSYHSRGLGFIKKNNSALLTRNINVVSLLFVAGVLKPLATIIGEIILFLLLFTALACYSPMAALITIAIFIPIMLLYYTIVRRRMLDIGKRENEAQRVKSRIVSETFRGYADIEIGGAHSLVFDRFERAIDDVVSLHKRSATINMLPQIFTEVGLVVGMIAIIIASIYLPSQNIGLLFGIFAVAAVRFIPSIRNILTCWSAIRLNHYTIDIISDADIQHDIDDIKRSEERMPFNHKIEIKNLTFQFDDATTPIINNLSLEINKGECIGIRGTSGVGKTTLFNLILGLYHPTSGEIAIDGEVLNDENISKWQNAIGYVSQSVFIVDMSLAENIAFNCAKEDIDYERLERCIALAELKEFVDSLDEGVHTRIGEAGSRISGGQRQRIGIARALYKGCDILLFDEATSSLDNKTEQSINNAIQNLSNSNKSLTIVVIAHRESSLEYCHRIITL